MIQNVTKYMVQNIKELNIGFYSVGNKIVQEVVVVMLNREHY